MILVTLYKHFYPEISNLIGTIVQFLVFLLLFLFLFILFCFVLFLFCFLFFYTFNLYPLGQNGRNFTDYIFKHIFFNENVRFRFKFH